METGNQEQVRQVLYARSKREEKMVDAMAGLAAATKKLKASAIETFGPAGATELIGDTNSLVTSQQRQLQMAQEKIAGDVAILTVGDFTVPPVVLQRVANEWRIPIAELAKGLTPAEFDQRVAQLNSQAAIMSETARLISANQYHTGQEAAEHMHKRMLKAATQTAMPSTAPTTASTP